MDTVFKEALEDSPIIAAIKDQKGLKRCVDSDSQIIFILYGDIVNIGKIVDEVKNAGKIAMVHIDLIQGLYGKEIAVDYIRNNTRADGIISTKAQLIQRAQELGLYTIMRFFVIDSMAYDNIRRQVRNVHPDVIEILPALMPKVIKKICDNIKTPLIAGGLVADKEDVMACLEAGAACISSTNQDVWFL